MKEVEDIIKSNIYLKEEIIKDKELINNIKETIDIIYNCFKNDGKLLLCGNGGSAADAQHLAAEFSGRFYIDRDPLFAEALHVNTSYLTAVANDYSFDDIYARLVKAFGRKKDVIIGLTTSGNSKNIINAFNEAKNIGMTTIAFTGESGGEIKNVSDYLINIPSETTPRIQESHIMVGHIICEIVEKRLFNFDI